DSVDSPPHDARAMTTRSGTSAPRMSAQAKAGIILMAADLEGQNSKLGLDRRSELIDQLGAGAQQLQRLLIDDDCAVVFPRQVAEQVDQVIDQRPESAPAECDQLDDAEADLPSIESIG